MDNLVGNIMENFVKPYYQNLDANPTALATLYRDGLPDSDSSMLHFNGQVIEGSDKIVAKLSLFSSKASEHIPTVGDVIESEGGFYVTVQGKIKLDGVSDARFSHMFYLKPDKEAFYVQTHMIRFNYA